MARFNEQVPGTKTKNLAGGDAYAASPRLELVSALLTSFMDNKYYESAGERVDRLKPLIKSDPLFAAKAAVYARNVYGMRSISHVVASEVAKHASGEPWANAFYKAVVHRPDDMTEILAYHLAHNGKISNAMKKGIGMAFDKFDAYQLAKYRAEGKGVSLVDVMRLTHPAPTDKNKEALISLKEGKLKNEKTWEAKVSAAGKEDGDKAENMSRAWAESLEGMGYMAVLRNLRNIEEQAPELIPRVVERLVDPKAIHKSLVLPFRFFSAMENVTDRNLKFAISQAADFSVANVPDLYGKTLIAVDVSGSMTGRPEQIARMFGAILFKATDSDMMIFQSYAEYVHLNPADSVFGIMNNMKFRSGGTNFNDIFDKANKQYDRVIILSDMQPWVERYAGYGYWSGGSNPKAALADYKQRAGCDPVIYSFDLQGYGQLSFPEHNVVALAGWSDKVFEFLSIIERGTKELEKKILEIEF